MKKKTIVSILFAFLLIFTISYAQKQYFIDKTGSIQNQDVEYINSLAEKLSEEENIDIVCVLVNDFLSKSAQEYADDFFDYNGYGRGNDKDGIILVINVKQRKYYISTCGRCINIFGKNMDKLKQSFIHQLKEQNYKQASINFIKKSAEIQKNSYSKNSSYSNLNYGQYLMIFLFSIFFGFVIAYLMVKSIENKENYTAKKNDYAFSYLDKEPEFDVYNDVFLYRVVNRVRKIKDTSTHTSSSGKTHGGSGGSF